MKDNIRRIIPFVISGLTIIVTFVLQFVALDFDRAFFVVGLFTAVFYQFVFAYHYFGHMAQFGDG